MDHDSSAGKRNAAPTKRGVGVLAALALAAALGMVACGRKPPTIPSAGEDGSPVVAMVGDQPVTLAMLDALAAQNNYNLRDAAQLKLALRDAVNVELLAAEARKHGYDRDPDIQRYVKSQSIQKLLLATVDKPGAAPVALPSEEEIKTHYENNVKEFTPPTVARAQVLALLKREGRETEFQQKLDAVKAAMEAKEAPFSELVKQFSDDPAAANSAGISNWIVKGEPSKQYPAVLVDAVFSAPDQSTILGPFEAGDWVYFARVHELREGRPAPYEQAKPRIVQELQRRQRLEAYDAFVQSLETSTGVQVFPDKASAALAEQTKEGGPPRGPVGP
jgi:parvulin-like peptidyl-prolyl isomerase